jgi:D-alanine-D-alanine ligase
VAEQRPPLRVAVVANRKYRVPVAADAPADALAEYDADETVEGIQRALRQTGHEVSFLEADETLLDTIRACRPDICFNIAEGLRGDARESHVPALLEMLGVPYTGSKVLTHAISLDKTLTKRVWRDYGLPTAPFQCFAAADEPLDQRLTFPLFVKPAREGSGMGINAHSIVHNVTELRRQVGWVITTYRQPALVESYLPGREFTVGFVGNRRKPGALTPPLSQGVNEAYRYDDRGYHVFPVLEIDTSRGQVRGIYNAEAKSYAITSEEAPGYLCPADIPAALEERLRDLAIAAFEAIGGLDVSRVDFRMGHDGEPYLVEINTLPGVNPIVSDIVIAARAGGVAYETLIGEILNLALVRYGML